MSEFPKGFSFIMASLRSIEPFGPETVFRPTLKEDRVAFPRVRGIYYLPAETLSGDDG
jgi:hypothetical protein